MTTHQAPTRLDALAKKLSFLALLLGAHCSAASAVLAEYRFDEGSYALVPRTVPDSSPSMAHGIAIGTVTSSANGILCRGVVVANNTNATISGIQTPFNVGRASGTIILAHAPNTRWTNVAINTLLDGAKVSGNAFHLVKQGNGALAFSVTDALGVTRTVTSTANMNYSYQETARIAVSWRFSGSDYTLRLDVKDRLNNASITTTEITGPSTAIGIHPSIGPVLLGDSLGVNTAGGGSLRSADGILDEVSFHDEYLSAQAVAALFDSKRTCQVARYSFEETAYTGAAAELKDTGLGISGPANGRAIGSPLPEPRNAQSAIPGSPGTCRYGRFPRQAASSGAFEVLGVPVSEVAGAWTTISLWMNPADDLKGVNGWANTYAAMPISFGSSIYGGQVALWLVTGTLTLTSYNSDRLSTSVATLPAGWHHVVVAINNWNLAASKIYIDKQPRTLTLTGTPFSRVGVSSKMNIGANIGYGSYRFSGDIDEVNIFTGELSDQEIERLYNETKPCTLDGPDHLRIIHTTGSTLTCNPTTLKIKACADAQCSSPYTAGVAGRVNATGANVQVNWPSTADFEIPAGQSEVTVALHLTTPGVVTVDVQSSVPSARSPSVCAFGASSSCALTAADSGFVFDVPDHVAGVTQTVSMSALRRDSPTQACVPAFASVTKSIRFRCRYGNPSTGTLPIMVAGVATNASGSAQAACDSSGQDVNVLFDANGATSIAVQYADAGLVELSATHTGSGAEAGLSMVGQDAFVAAPASFAIAGYPAGNLKAGQGYTATVTSLNANGAPTANFGNETPPSTLRLGLTRRSPTGTGAQDGSFGGGVGSFDGGRAPLTNLTWSEVGRADVQVTLSTAGYLGSSLNPSGSTGLYGALSFVPHHFDALLTPACGGFSYTGQPSKLRVEAKAMGGSITKNYDGSTGTSPNFSRATSIQVVGQVPAGTISSNALSASTYVGGVAESLLSYAPTNKRVEPFALTLRVSDTDGVSSEGGTEQSIGLRSGRMRVANAFGSANQVLQLQVVGEYWSGQNWILNSADSCTAVAAASVALSNRRDALGATSAATTQASGFSLVGGNGVLRLAKPTPAGNSLTVDVAINLGNSTQDTSCHASTVTSVGANAPWLRSEGACKSTATVDPAARASFGVYTPETRRIIHSREIF